MRPISFSEEEYGEKCVNILLDGEAAELVFIDHSNTEISVLGFTNITSMYSVTNSNTYLTNHNWQSNILVRIELEELATLMAMLTYNLRKMFFFVGGKCSCYLHA